jgi:hypothetical protein
VARVLRLHTYAKAAVMKTAKALGLALPGTPPAVVDEVI